MTNKTKGLFYELIKKIKQQVIGDDIEEALTISLKKDNRGLRFVDLNTALTLCEGAHSADFFEKVIRAIHSNEFSKFEEEAIMDEIMNKDPVEEYEEFNRGFKKNNDQIKH